MPDCPRSPDGRHHWETVTQLQDTIERQMCAYCADTRDAVTLVPGEPGTRLRVNGDGSVDRLYPDGREVRVTQQLPVLMPGFPDFDQIARVLLERLSDSRSTTEIQDRYFVAEQLRQVWNARGAADVQALRKAWDVHAAIHELRTLDR